MTGGLGHNRGPSLEPGGSWRRHCWTKARKDLIPHLPIEILRRRVRRAQELGLEYKTYASVRASTGRDVIGFLFSSNALRVFRDVPNLPPERADKLSGLVKCDRIALAVPPMQAADLIAATPEGLLDRVQSAPGAFAGWGEARDSLQQACRSGKLPADGVLLVGDTSAERDWSEAARLAGYLPADRYFGDAAT